MSGVGKTGPEGTAPHADSTASERVQTYPSPPVYLSPLTQTGLLEILFGW